MSYTISGVIATLEERRESTIGTLHGEAGQEFDAFIRDHYETSIAAYDAAIAALEICSDYHYGNSCHPEADCDHGDRADTGTILFRFAKEIGLQELLGSASRGVADFALLYVFEAIGEHADRGYIVSLPTIGEVFG